jgi:hypothetical protein
MTDYHEEVQTYLVTINIGLDELVLTFYENRVLSVSMTTRRRSSCVRPRVGRVVSF